MKRSASTLAAARLTAARLMAALLVALAVWALAAQPALAQGCAMCGSSLKGAEDPLGRSLSYSVLFMMSMPFLLFVSIAGWLVHRHRAASHQEEAAMEATKKEESLS